jgi:hypothetical protein
MQSRRVCLASLATVLILCSSCSKNVPDSQRGRESEASETSSPPNISPSSAPGIAFNFAYQFNLPDDRISATQEAHASACEKLGLEHCRITGMSYIVDQNEEVTAELDLKLDPLIARQFGKSAQQSVEGNDGKLVRLQITSADEGQAIQQRAKQKNDVSARIAELQQELARTKAGSAEHARLLSQIQELQQQASEQSRAIEANQDALASTPIEFHYYGRGRVPGFRGNPVREAWQTFATTIVWIVQIILQALAVLVPLGILLAIFIALWRTKPMRLFRGWLAGPREAEG